MPGAGKRRAKQNRQQKSPGGGSEPQDEQYGEKPKPGASSLPIEDMHQLDLGNSDFLPPQKRLAKPNATKPLFPGLDGKGIYVRVNHFPLTVKVPEGVVYMYNVVIKPPWSRDYRRSDRIIYHKVVKEWKNKCPQIVNPYGLVFNGKDVLYSAMALHAEDIKPMDVEMSGETKPLEFSVGDVRMIKKIPVNQDILKWLQNGRSGNIPQDSIQALDLILSQAVTTDLCVETIGRSYFPQSGQVLDIGFGREVWTGNFSSVRPVKMGWKNGNCLSLNVDVSNKPALKELHLTDGKDSYIQQMLGSKRGQCVDMKKGLVPHQLDILRKDIKGLKIRYELPNGRKRSYRVNDLVAPPNEQKIPDLGKTVEQYFKDEYKKQGVLKYPKMPCLWVGSREKTIYIPVEFCKMEKQPQPRSKKLPDDAISTMIKGTAIRPLDREKKIMEGLKVNNNILKDDPYAKNFGVSIAGEFATLKARILQPPSIGYNKSEVEIDSKAPGSWRQGRRDLYVDGKVIYSWAVLDLSFISEKQKDDMIQGFSDIGRNVGLRINGDPNKIWFGTCDEGNVTQTFKNMVEASKKARMSIDIVLVILPFKGGFAYNTIKQLGDIEYKIPTQCCVKSNLFKWDPRNRTENLNQQVISNLCLKMNAKLGGTNHVLAPKSRPSFLDEPVMIMGADVTHPAPEHKGLKPSIAAVVASMDPRALSNYEVQVRVQSSEQNEEVIQDMKNITIKLLKSFYRRTKGLKPFRIFMFRDGVSEGQFLTVLRKELLAIQAACKQLQEGYEPLITYMVVQKRHHTRIFPMDPNDPNQYRRNGNVLAGTVVDQGINHPTEGDFYLVSHEGIQGTSRPTHYQVLWDDSDLSADALESLSFYLCHLYARCSRSVSYPTPTYYSHLAADRARKHVDELTLNNIKEPKIKDIIENLNEGETSDKYNMYFV